MRDFDMIGHFHFVEFCDAFLDTLLKAKVEISAALMYDSSPLVDMRLNPKIKFCSEHDKMFKQLGYGWAVIVNGQEQTVTHVQRG